MDLLLGGDHAAAATAMGQYVLRNSKKDFLLIPWVLALISWVSGTEGWDLAKQKEQKAGYESAFRRSCFGCCWIRTIIDIFIS